MLFFVSEVYMLTLTVFNIVLLIIIGALLYLVKRTVKTERAENILLLVSAVITVLFHYSTFIFHLLTGGEAIEYLRETPNLLLPIYPCNVVMWSCVILPFLKGDGSKARALISDYVFWFGIFSTLVGMFANVDFINNPTLRDYEITKSIVAHATLLFNVLLLPLFGRIRFDFLGNMKNMVISVLGMYVIGLYCNLVFEALVSYERAYDVNSMFLIHSPFEGLDFLRYPVIAAIALVLYAILFFTLDTLKRKRGERFIDRVCALFEKRKIGK